MIATQPRMKLSGMIRSDAMEEAPAAEAPPGMAVAPAETAEAPGGAGDGGRRRRSVEPQLLLPPSFEKNRKP